MALRKSLAGRETTDIRNKTIRQAIDLLLEANTVDNFRGKQQEVEELIATLSKDESAPEDEKNFILGCAHGFLSNPNKYLAKENKVLVKDLDEAERAAADRHFELSSGYLTKCGDSFRYANFLRKYNVNLLSFNTITLFGSVYPEVMIGYIHQLKAMIKPIDVFNINALVYRYTPDYQRIINALHANLMNHQLDIEGMTGVFSKINHPDKRFFAAVLLEFDIDHAPWLTDIIQSRLQEIVEQCVKYRTQLSSIVGNKNIREELDTNDFFILAVSRFYQQFNRSGKGITEIDPALSKITDIQRQQSAIRKLAQLIPICQQVNTGKTAWQRLTSHLFFSAPEGVLEFRSILQPIRLRLNTVTYPPIGVRECNAIFSQMVEMSNKKVKPYTGCGKRDPQVVKFYQEVRAQLMHVPVEESKEQPKLRM